MTAFLRLNPEPQALSDALHKYSQTAEALNRSAEERHNRQRGLHVQGWKVEFRNAWYTENPIYASLRRILRQEGDHENPQLLGMKNAWMGGSQTAAATAIERFLDPNSYHPHATRP